MILQDFIMLGKTIPEPNSDGRIFVCSAGVSPELRSLVRLYPLSRMQAPRRWSVNEVPVERNPRDSRIESFCLKGNRDPDNHTHINGLFRELRRMPRTERDIAIAPYRVSSIAAANDSRRSLAILEPDGVARLDFEECIGSPSSPQLSLFAEDETEKLELGARRFAYQPRLMFRDAGGWHDLQLRDWGVYEFMRKQGDSRRYELNDACRLASRPMLLVGNMNGHRNVWLIISILFPVAAQSDLFLSAEVSA
jgi:hypothetical protein